MRRIRIKLEYDGTGYAGWQLQKNGELTIQGELERALFRLCGENVRVHGAGRTDAGVHSLAQVAHFDLPGNIPIEKLPNAMNAHLPGDIMVYCADEVDENFDSRRHARGKIYRYRIRNTARQSVFDRRYTWLIKKTLDIEAMQNAAVHLVGEHDFSSFQGARCSAKHAVRYIYKLDVLQRGEEVVIETFATAYLKHMVRNIVGTLVQVGNGEMKPEDMQAILQTKDRSSAGPTAPSRGLIQVKIFYKDDPPPLDLMRLIPESHRMR